MLTLPSTQTTSTQQAMVSGPWPPSAAMQLSANDVDVDARLFLWVGWGLWLALAKLDASRIQRL